jgi:hypothetical protein
MKNIFNTKIFSGLIAACTMLVLFTACEQTGVAPILNTAPGGGTITTFKAYSLDSIPGAGRVYGRVVFWLDNAGNTLVQISLYNTKAGSAYPSGIYAGSLANGSASTVSALTPVDGTAGEFSPYKYFVVGKAEFYESLDDLDGHVSIFLDTTPVAEGDVGKNAEPVQTGS